MKKQGKALLEEYWNVCSANAGGYFKIVEDAFDFETSEGYIRITQSFIADAYGRSNDPVCHYLLGMIVGLLVEITGSQLIGEENLPEDQQLTIFIAKLIKEGFLIQNAFDNIDNYTNSTKLLGMIKIILLLNKEGKELLKQGFLIEDIKRLKTLFEILRINRTIQNKDFNKIEELKRKLLNEIESLKLTHGVFKK